MFGRNDKKWGPFRVGKRRTQTAQVAEAVASGAHSAADAAATAARAAAERVAEEAHRAAERVDKRSHKMADVLDRRTHKLAEDLESRGAEMAGTLAAKAAHGPAARRFGFLTKSKREPNGGQNVGRKERIASLVAAVPLLIAAARQRNMATGALGLVGGEMAYRGLTGHCPVYGALGISTARS